MYRPFNFNDINVAEGLYSPSTQKIHNTTAFMFWQRAFYDRLVYSIKSNIPWTGDIKNFFNWCLYGRGFVTVFDNPEYGFTFQPCTLSGYGFYYQPTKVLVSNPLLNSTLEMEIGKDCELLKLTPDFFGVWDIINYYATKCALLDSGIDMNITNSKFAYALGAKNKAVAEALKKIFDKIDKGESTVIYDKSIFNDDENESVFDFISRDNLKSGYIVTEQIADLETIIRMFDTEIGISTVPYEKKERMVVSEAESKENESNARITTWLECLNESATIINNHYGTNLKFEKRIDTDGNVDTMGDGNISKDE